MQQNLVEMCKQYPNCSLLLQFRSSYCYTVGHSNLPWFKFLKYLSEQQRMDGWMDGWIIAHHHCYLEIKYWAACTAGAQYLQGTPTNHSSLELIPDSGLI